MGVQIVGVSFNSNSDNASWASSEGFQFELWTDDDRSLAVYYGAADSTDAWFPNRITRILDANGNMILEYNTVDVSTSPYDVLNDCGILFDDD